MDTSLTGLPWMGFALLAFSMTTLWPVTYIYFDVALLFICASLAETAWVRESPAQSAAVALAAAVAVIVAVAVVQIPRAEPSRYRRPGREEVLIPRLGRGDAVIEIDVLTDMPGQMTALLNGTPPGRSLSGKMSPAFLLGGLCLGKTAVIGKLHARLLQRLANGPQIIGMRGAPSRLEIADRAARYPSLGRQLLLGPIQPRSRCPALFW